jgi:hypothetical protein
MKNAVAVCLLLLVLLPAATSRADDPIESLTNEDVVALTKAGLGEAVIVAKIQEAPRTEFDLATDDLIALNTAGVDEDVIEAMLERGSGLPPRPSRSGPAAAPAPAAPMGGTIATPMGPMVMGAAGTEVWLATDEGEFPLSGILGESSMTWAYVTTFTYLNFAGLGSAVRTRDPSPKIVVASDANPTGRFYITRLERDDDDEVRSLKMGRSNPFKPQMSLTPDPDWLVAFESVEDGPGYWRLRPKRRLADGEYGVLVRGSQELFDFAVDGAGPAPEAADDEETPRWKLWKRGRNDPG